MMTQERRKKMSCRANDILVDLAIDKVDELIKINPSIPEESRTKLEEELFKSLKEDEGDAGDYWEAQLKEEE